MEDFFHVINSLDITLNGVAWSQECAGLFENSVYYSCSYPIQKVKMKKVKSTDLRRLSNKSNQLPAVTERRSGRRRATMPLVDQLYDFNLYEEDENFTPSTRSYSQCSSDKNSTDDCLFSSTNYNGSVEMTLLQKAELFRKEKPHLWEERQKEKERRLQESSVNSDEKDDFLSSYYEQQETILKRKKEKEHKRKFEVPKLKVQLKQQNFINFTSSGNNKNTCENYYENFTVFEKEKFSDIFSCENAEDQQTVKPEFHIIVTSGKYLLNYLKKGADKFNYCKVRCYFYLGKNNEEKVSKSRSVYITTKGEAKVDHTFILRGYTSKELALSYVSLVVTGKAKDGRHIIGNSVLSGKYAKVWDEKTCTFRNPTISEVTNWEEAVSRSQNTVHASVDLQRPISFDTEGLFVSLTQAFTDFQDQKSIYGDI